MTCCLDSTNSEETFHLRPSESRQHYSSACRQSPIARRTRRGSPTLKRHNQHTMLRHPTWPNNLPFPPTSCSFPIPVFQFQKSTNGNQTLNATMTTGLRVQTSMSVILPETEIVSQIASIQLQFSSTTTLPSWWKNKDYWIGSIQNWKRTRILAIPSSKCMRQRWKGIQVSSLPSLTATIDDLGCEGDGENTKRIQTDVAWIQNATWKATHS